MCVYWSPLENKKRQCIEYLAFISRGIHFSLIGVWGFLFFFFWVSHAVFEVFALIISDATHVAHLAVTRKSHNKDNYIHNSQDLKSETLFKGYQTLLVI